MCHLLNRKKCQSVYSCHKISHFVVDSCYKIPPLCSCCSLTEQYELLPYRIRVIVFEWANPYAV